MDQATDTAAPFSAGARRLLHRLFAIGENRLQLFALEMEEERDRLLAIFMLVIAIGALGILCGIAWSAAIVLALWSVGPGWVLLGLGAFYAAATFGFYLRLSKLRRCEPSLSATLDQIKKDCACFQDKQL